MFTQKTYTHEGIEEMRTKVFQAKIFSASGWRLPTSGWGFPTLEIEYYGPLMDSHLILALDHARTEPHVDGVLGLRAPSTNVLRQSSSRK